MSVQSVCGQLRSGSWAGDAPQYAVDGCASIPGIAGLALKYVSPLQDWFDELTGDPSGVTADALVWHDASRDIADTITALHGALANLDELQGRSIRALQERHRDTREFLQDAEDWTSATAAAIDLAGTIVRAVRESICGLLSSLSRLWDSLFSFTLNPFEKADQIRDFADAAWDVVELGRDLVSSIITAIGQFGALLEELAPLIEAAARDLLDLVSRMLPAIALLTGGPIAALIATGLGDLGKNDPSVRELDPSEAADPRAYDELMQQGEITSPVDLIHRNGLVDSLGGSGSTNISVSTITRPDGSTYTLVNLPSTQDWNALSGIMGQDAMDSIRDAGAMNDLDSNIALMLMDNPVFRTQYERAVMDAMRDAGVPPGSDVVYSGFSQGGIMAGNLAADRNSPYNTVGVVTNGSPIDRFDIPSSIPVMQVEHQYDVVPKLDGATPNSNVDWIVMPGGAHGSAPYEASLQQFYDQGGQTRTDWNTLLGGRVDSVYVGRASE